MAADELDVPVLIVGGSLVGLSAALLLGRHGIPALSVEHHPGTAIHPRAAAATQRTVEILRSVGLEGAIVARSSEQFVQDGGIVAVETLFGGPTAHYIEDLNAGVRDVSPCERLFLSQSALEPFLRERAMQLGATLRFNTDVESLTEDAAGVHAVLRERSSGETTRVRARYAIAADGAHSRIRSALGIAMEGRPTFSRSATLYFRADLAAVLAERKWAVVYVNNDRMRGFFRFEKPFDRAFLAINTLGPPGAPDTDVTRNLDERRASELVRIALGNDAVDVQIDRIMAWDAAAQTASRFRHGRVFLAGDAAHVMPPTGGFGGNTGVQDAHNLAWKMALVLRGAADETLLDTYEAERRPVATLTVDQAYVRYALRTDRTLATPSLSPLIDDLDIELGYIYRSAAVASEIGDAPGHLNPRATHALPGSRAPHHVLTRNGAQCSTLDLYGDGFTLLGGPDAQAWIVAARSAAADLEVPLRAWRPGADGLEDPGGELAQRHGIAADGCVLVRPDGFVAWRARDAANATPDRVRSIMRKILGIPTTTGRASTALSTDERGDLGIPN